MLLGYPGRTVRHQTSHFVRYEQDVRLPYVVDVYTWAIRAMEAAGAEDRAVARANTLLRSAAWPMSRSVRAASCWAFAGPAFSPPAKPKSKSCKPSSPPIRTGPLASGSCSTSSPRSIATKRLPPATS